MAITIISLGVALAVLVTALWWVRTHSVSRHSSEARCRRDIKALRRTSQARSSGRRPEDVWSAGADPDPAQSRGKKTVAWVALGAVGGGCGGCGGCGCGG